MAYNNRRSYSNNSYNRSYSSNSYSGGGYGSNRRNYQRKKTSGCTIKLNATTSTGRKMEVIASGWLKTRNGLISYVGSPASDKYQKQDSDNVKMVFKVTQGVQKNVFWGTYNPHTQSIYIQEMNIIGMKSKNASFFRKGR